MSEFNDLTQGQKDRQKRINYYWAYSALFLMTAYFVYSWFFKYGFAIILDSDGIKQSYSTFLYLGKYMRLIWTNLIHFNFTIPLWDHNIGYGADIISTLHYYGIGDPLNFVSFITPQSYSELVYELLLIARLYFAGLFFLAYCFKMKTDYMPALIGAFIYVWTGFSFVGSLWLITGFMSVMIYLPMALLGLEKILRNEKPHFFIVSVFFALLTNFYLFYMLSCFIFLYFIVRAPFAFKEDNKGMPLINQVKAFFKGAGLKNSLKCFVRFCISYAIGCFMACIIFIPDFFLLIHSTRMKVSVFRWFYDNTYYRELFMSLFNIYPLSFEWIFIGICYLALFAAVLLFFKRKQFAQIKIVFVILVLCLIFPLGGKIIHGFSYASIRWVWAFNFFMAFAAAVMLPYMIRIKTKEIIAITAITLLYIAGCIYLYRNIFNIVLYGYLLALVFLLVLFAVSKLKINKFLSYILVFVVVFLNILLGAFYSYRYNFGTYKVKIGEILPSITRTSHNSVKNIDDPDSFYRYEENPFGLDIYTNSSMLVGVKGTSYYYSLAVPYIYEWLGGLEHYTEFDFMYYGLDGRTIMDALASVKYFISADGAEAYKPYGFDKRAGSFKAHRRMLYHAYETKNTLPLGYTYSNYLPHSEYERLDAVQRQEIMTQTAVLLKDLPADFEQAKNLTIRSIKIPFWPMASDGVVLENNKLIILKSGGGMQIGFNALPNSETYLRFTNITCPNYKEAVTVNVFSSGVNKKFEVYSPKFVRYIGKKNYMINMGFSEVVKTSTVMTFPTDGTLTFDSMEVISLPLGDAFEKEIAALKEDILENVQLEGNTVSGHIDLKSNKILVLSLPYNEGWKAYVNGKKVPLLRANIMFMGLALKAGSYDIKLVYRTPGLVLGLCLFILGWLSFIAIIFKDRLQKRFKFLKILESL
ncbi:MAG: YfhO family protein [Elusimicrobiota bacterium]|jgi:uncharacterized membrane protein YfhO|nr:YfhO family protein [Elusimicrobiota bacterium]